MRDAEMLVWAGDFNYRIETDYDDALEHIRNNDLDYLIDRVSPPACLLPLTAKACTFLPAVLHSRNPEGTVCWR